LPRFQINAGKKVYAAYLIKPYKAYSCRSGRIPLNGTPVIGPLRLNKDKTGVKKMNMGRRAKQLVKVNKIYAKLMRPV